MIRLQSCRGLQYASEWLVVYSTLVRQLTRASSSQAPRIDLQLQIRDDMRMPSGVSFLP
jgi:hypothetical protein